MKPTGGALSEDRNETVTHHHPKGGSRSNVLPIGMSIGLAERSPHGTGEVCAVDEASSEGTNIMKRKHARAESEGRSPNWYGTGLLTREMRVRLPCVPLVTGPWRNGSALGS